MEAKTIKDIEAGEGIRQNPDFIASKIPDIVRKEDVGARLEDYWCDTVVPGLIGEWFQISREGNKIIVQPVTISYPEGNGCWNMDKKQLDRELDKIHENFSGDEIYIPNSLVNEILGGIIERGIK